MSRDKAHDQLGFRKFEEFVGHWSRRDFLHRVGGGMAWVMFMAGGGELLEACTIGSPASSSKAVKQGGQVVEGSASDVSQLNPVLVKATDTTSSTVSGLLYDGLLGSKANGDLYPRLAKEMPNASADGTTYTFALRENVKFSDGSQITADDVKFTYDLIFDPQYVDVNSPLRAELAPNLQSITAPDPKTIIFKTKQAYAPFLAWHGQYGVLPRAVWGKLSPQQINTTDLNLMPTVTSGAFKPAKYDKGVQYVVAANERHWQGRPNIDRWVFKVVPGTALADQLKTGEVDCGRIDASQLADVQAIPEVGIATFLEPIFNFYAYQLDPAKPASKLFSDKAVRQALLLALNRPSMADAIYYKQAVVATSSVPQVSWAYNKEAKPQYRFDKAKAESMLDSAGWTKGPDGIRAKGGTKLRFNVVTNAGNKPRELLVVEMQQRWKDIGVEASPQLVSYTELLSQIEDTRTFDVFLVGYRCGQDPDQSQLWSSGAAIPGGLNGMQYKNPQLDKILSDAAATLDQKRRKELYFQVQDILNEEVPGGILVFNKGVWGIRKRMHGITGGDFGLGPYTQVAQRPWMRTMFVADGK
jgi:peptide/nickel transport system substrate-binding protein